MKSDFEDGNVFTEKRWIVAQDHTRRDISGGTMAACVGRFAYEYKYVLYGTGYDSTHERYV